MIKICISKSSLQFIVEKLKKITFQYFFVIFYEDLQLLKPENQQKTWVKIGFSA